MLILQIMLSLMTLLACDGMEQRGGGPDVPDASPLTGRPSTDSDQILKGSTEYSEAPTPAAPGPAPETKTIALPFNALALVGPTLTCTTPSAADGLTRCSAKDAAGGAYDFKAKKAFFIGRDLNWIESGFYADAGVGAWFVKLPSITGVKSFAISLVDDSSVAMLDWVLDPTDEPTNLVKDGSFEQNVVVPGNRNTQFLIPSLQTNWFAKSVSGLCQDIIELGLNWGGLDPPYVGNQWIELD